ncbi:MAG: hypothetical protein ACO2YW_03845 [Candidatus Nanopelagicaceae bacterium]|jgi:hypothetical protein
MGSGLIYIIIVGMWIAYFLPRWITNHEEVSGRSIEKFASTMRVVGKTSGNASDELTDLLRKKDNQLLIRRILFVSLLGLTLIVAVFSLVGFLSPAIIAIPISGFGLYVVHARHQMSALNDEIIIASNAVKQIEKSTGKYSELIARSKRLARSKEEVADEQWTPLSERLARSESEVHGITILPKGSAHKTWDPVSVPPPSYASSPKAAPRRRIDLTVPGAWSASQEEELKRFLKPSADEIFDQTIADEVEEQIRTNRAANE